MDSRTAAHVLTQIAAHLELRGENAFKIRAYRGAAKSLLALGADDLAPPLTSGELSTVRGLGPATLAVVRDLVETGESRYLEQLRESAPQGLLDMLDVPGMTPPRIHQVYEVLGIQTVEELEAAARDGRLATLPKLGPKTAAKILKGVATARARGSLRLYHHVAAEAVHLVASVREHPDVARAELAGALRRCVEVVGTIDVVAACRGDSVEVARSFTRTAGVTRADERGGPGSVFIQYVDGAQLHLHCVREDEFGVAFWRATGNVDHVDAVREALTDAGVVVDRDRLRRGDGTDLAVSDERGVYAAAGLQFVEPELREGLGEVDAARRHVLPSLVTPSDIRGVLHCHSQYSDGKASIADMARAARDRGWSYIGITDHSEAAFYAGGLTRARILSQHDEIDELNATFQHEGIRVLKGIEADILADGRLDYDDELLESFDFVVGSIHSRFSMDVAAMTERVLRALDDPRLTILGHPTGRLLLAREPYALDVDAVLEKARDVGAAVEHNADPHRLDLDWRHLRRAKALGVPVAIGPDAHSVGGLDNVRFGINMARKGWLEPADVLNTGDADAILAFARARRSRG